MLGGIEAKEPRIEVRWGWESDESMEAIREVFRSEGLEVKLTRIPPAGNGAGILLPISVYDVAVGAFVVAFATAAGKDAWEGTKRLVLRLKSWFKEKYMLGDAPHDQLTVILHHPEAGTTVYISSEMPDEAFEKLYALEFEPNTDYSWNDDTGEWEATGPE